MSRTIALVGASGAGKSTVGDALARRLGVPHVDVDAEIEDRTGLLIREIFAEHGERYFRDLERDLTLEALGRPGVVSLGGGAPMTPAVAEALKGHPVVWLKVSVGEAVKRIGLDEGRPLLSGTGIRATLIRMLAERSPVYEAVSSLVVDTSELDVDAVVAAVAEHVRPGADGLELR